MKIFKPGSRLSQGTKSTGWLRKQRGFSMIEILITLLVLSIGALGMAALQGFSLQSGQNAYFRTQATNLAYEVTDFTRTNRSIATSAWVQAEFAPRVAAVLPGGTVAVVLNGNDQLQVTITWSEDRLDDSVVGDEQIFVVNTQI